MKTMIFYSRLKFEDYCDSNNKQNTTTFLIDFDKVRQCKHKFGKRTLITNLKNDTL